MKPLPYMEPIEDAAELLAVVSSSKKWTERLEKMIAHEEYMKEAVEKAKAIGDLEQALNLARSDRAEAQRAMAEAEDYAKDRRKEADEYEDSARVKILGKENDLVAQGLLLAQQLKEVGEEKERLQSFDETVRKAEVEAQTEKARAQAVMKEALAVKADYTERLEKLKSLSA